jgi:hypothetical protein
VEDRPRPRHGGSRAGPPFAIRLSRASLVGGAYPRQPEVDSLSWPRAQSSCRGSGFRRAAQASRAVCPAAQKKNVGRLRVTAPTTASSGRRRRRVRPLWERASPPPRGGTTSMWPPARQAGCSSPAAGLRAEPINQFGVAAGSFPLNDVDASALRRLVSRSRDAGQGLRSRSCGEPTPVD